MALILASASPRRKQLLTMLGLTFEVRPAAGEEILPPGIAPEEAVKRLSAQKAAAVAETCAPGDIVIGADTIVVYRGEILGKPAHKSEAYDMLSMLSDRTHQVYTGVSLIVRKCGRTSVNTFYEKTDVTFYPVHKDDLRAYVESGDSLDKAGAYGIQGDFAIHVKEIRGDYNNVVGLPVGRLYQELQQLIYGPK